MAKIQNRWIRINFVDAEGKTILGHAGRKGFILPNEDPTQRTKFVAKTYDNSETHYGDLVGDLKKMLDVE